MSIKDLIREVVAEVVAEAMADTENDTPITVKGELKNDTKPRNRRLRADAVEIAPITVTIKNMADVEPWMQAKLDKNGKIVRDKKNQIVYAEVGRIFKGTVTTKGEPKDAKVFVSGVYVKTDDLDDFNPKAAISVKIKPEVLPNKDQSAKHSKGGNIKTRNQIVLDGTGKFYVNGYFPVQ